MTPLITSIVERLAFPGMEILLKHEYVPVDHYCASPEDMRQRLWVEATSDSGNRQVVTIQELCGLLGVVDPTALASDVDAAAHIAAVLLGLRRVVNNHELYKHLETRFGIQLSSQARRGWRGCISSS